MPWRRVRAYVGLGSERGDARRHARRRDPGAGARLQGVRLRGVSPLYATAPVGVLDQPDFRNAAVALDVPGRHRPGDRCARPAGRTQGPRAQARRRARRWGPREVDLDLLVFGRHGSAWSARRPLATARRAPRPLAGSPHPAARERLFVLAPLADLAPRLRPPGWGETVATARARAESTEGPAAARAVASWDPDRSAWVER